MRRSRRRRSPEPPPGDFGQDEPTIVDGKYDTPVTMPRCAECARVVFFDDFTPAASIIAEGLFNGDRCVRSRPEAKAVWWWCGERRKFVYFVPR